MDENDPLKKLIVLFKSEGYIGKEAVEEAKAELERRREHEELERRREHEELERRREHEELERRREHELRMKKAGRTDCILKIIPAVCVILLFI